jgi:hypothetical protein
VLKNFRVCETEEFIAGSFLVILIGLKVNFEFTSAFALCNCITKIIG